jgi:hypothetical protein
MNGLMITKQHQNTSSVLNTWSTRHQPSCRRHQHRNCDTKRLRLTQPAMWGVAGTS